MKVFIIYIMLFALCINVFGASLGQFIHQLSHLFDSQKGHLEMVEYADMSTHFHPVVSAHHTYHPENTNNYHKHNQIVDFMLHTFSIQNANTALPDFTFISLFMLIIDGIINNMNINVLFNSADEHSDKKRIVAAFLYKSLFLKTPSPPPKVLIY